MQAKIRVYLKEPPTEAELREVLAKLGVTAAQIVRTGEKAFKELELKNADDDTLIAAMVANPILIERPIVIKGDKAVVGRPPENVLSLL